MEKLRDMGTELEGIINRLSGVISSKIIHEEGEVSEIHVLTNKSRSPKQISRDIQSSYAASTGGVLDHKIISIAQIDDGFNSREIGRMVLDRISYRNGFDGTAEIVVAIRLDDRVAEGSRDGVPSKRNLHRMIVEAALDAIESLIDLDEKIVYEDYEQVRISKEDVAMVAVCILSGRREELLIGTAKIKGDEREATVRATLDALNRKLSII